MGHLDVNTVSYFLPDGRPLLDREEAARALDRYELARASEQTLESLSGGRQAWFQILLLELSGATPPVA